LRLKPTREPVFSNALRTLDLLLIFVFFDPSGLVLSSLSSTAFSTMLLVDGLSLNPSTWLEEEDVDAGDFELDEAFVFAEEEEDEETERDKEREERRLFSFFFSFFSFFSAFFLCSSWSFSCCCCWCRKCWAYARL